MSLDDYKLALKAGQRDYRARVAQGQSPYLAVLDDILVNVELAGQEPLGLVDIPVDKIAGTKTSGRHTAFSAGFMPLLGLDTEFADKWNNLCRAHLNEGIHSPITAYEFLNRFYVVEGNKRVSVLKYFGAVTISGTVTRLIPVRSDSLENRLYYEFLDFYRLSHYNNISFSRPGGFVRLQKAVCKATGEEWDDDDRSTFAAFNTIFTQQFQALGGSSLAITAGDAMLVYLSVYRYADACSATPAQVRANLQKMWDEVTVLTKPNAVHLSLEPPEEKPTPEMVLSKLTTFIPRRSELKVVFLHEHDAASSAWVRSHDQGRQAMEKAFPGRLQVVCREHVDPMVDAEQVLEEEAHNGAGLIFTSSSRMMPACVKVALQHPEVKILNCSLNVPHPKVRTYFPRTFEAKYLLGMLAGVLSPGNWIGYNASFPIYGVPAGINAFAQGVKAVRPQARVLLRWGCCPEPGKPLDYADRPDIPLFFSLDPREPANVHRELGLCRRMPDGTVQPLALMTWRWDVMYNSIVRSVLNGSWADQEPGRAINYWWGMRSGMVSIQYTSGLPAGTRQLLDLMEHQLCESSLGIIFPSEGYAQGHKAYAPRQSLYTPEELMRMEWLDECVVGRLPDYEALDARTRKVVDSHGLDAVKPAGLDPLL